MTIAELRERSNTALSGFPTDVLVVGVVLLSASASFGLGYLAGKGEGTGPGFWIEDVSATSSRAAAPAAVAEAAAPRIPTVSPGTAVVPAEGKYVASKNGTKYYLPDCSGAKRIKAENKVWFASAGDARAAGLSPAVNCPGL